MALLSSLPTATDSFRDIFGQASDTNKGEQKDTPETLGKTKTKTKTDNASVLCPLS